MHSTMVHLGDVSSSFDPTPSGGIDANKTFTAGHGRRFGRDARAGGARASAKPAAGRPHRTCHLRSGRRDGGGGSQRQEGGLDGHRQRRQRCARPLQLSGQSTERRKVLAQDPRHRLRPHRVDNGGRHRRTDRHGRSQTAQGEEPGRADEQRRMDDEPTRRGGSESLPARLRRLPYARTHRALDPRCG